MTAKEKAKDLIEKFTFGCRECDDAKLSALIAVDEILLHEKNSHSVLDKATERWREVREAIENL